MYAPYPTVPVAEVVTLPPSSPLRTPYAAAAVMSLTVDSNMDSNYDDNGSNPEQPSEFFGQWIADSKTTWLF
jgi:hypothetical protein